MLVLAVVNSAVIVIVPYFEGLVINTLISGDKAGIFVYICLAMVLIFAVKLIISYFLSKLIYVYIPRLELELNELVLGELLEKDAFEIMKFDGASLNKRISEDVGSVINFKFSVIPKLLSSIILILSISLVIIKVKPIMFLYFIAIVIIYALIYTFNKKKLYDIFYEVRSKSDVYNAIRNSNYMRLITIKTQMLNKFEKDRLQTKTDDLLKVMDKDFELNYILSTLKIVVVSISQFVFFIVGGLAVVRKNLSVGVFTAVIQYFGEFINCLESFFTFGVERQSYMVAQNRLYEILNMQDDVEGSKIVTELKSLELEGFNAYYQDDALLYADNLTKKFTKGNLYILKGKNGSGKTTLLMNLLGVYQNKSVGNIMVNGTNLCDVNKKHFREHVVSFMFQNSFPVSILLREYLTAFITQDDMQEVLKKPEFKTVFKSSSFDLSMCLDKNLEELSGGERQLVNLFATLSKQGSELIILDEPLVNVASDLRYAVLALIKNIAKEKIVIIVTHHDLDVDNAEILEIV